MLWADSLDSAVLCCVHGLSAGVRFSAWACRVQGTYTTRLAAPIASQMMGDIVELSGLSCTTDPNVTLAR